MDKMSADSAAGTAVLRGNLLILVLLCAAISPCLAQYYDSTARYAAEDFVSEVKAMVGAHALTAFPPEDVLALSGTLGQLDRVSISPAVFLEHLREAEAVRNRFYQEIPAESFQNYILGIRIRAEFTSHSAWRARFRKEFEGRLQDKKDVKSAAQEIFRWVRSKVRLTGEKRTYPLNLKGDMDPLTTLRGGRGNETDVAILVVAVLRSCGIASRIVYAPVIAGENGGKTWAEYRDEKEWKPWVPSAPEAEDHLVWLKNEFSGKWGYVLADPSRPTNVTPRYGPTSVIWTCPVPLLKGHFDSSFLVWSGGRLEPVMGRDIYNPDPEDAARGMGAGVYVCSAGDRATMAGLKFVQLRAGVPGWYQLDFSRERQDYASGSRRPSFFEWTPPENAPDDVAAAW